MYDVTIRGAGIFGLSIAWECVKRGAKVQIIDPHGVGAGASGGIVGALAPHVPENWNAKKELQFQSLIKAERFWIEVEENAQMTSGYMRTGRLQPIADEHALMLAKVRNCNAKELWKGLAAFEVVSDAQTWAPPSPTGQWIYDSLSAHIHPYTACHALKRALETQGVTFHAESEAQGMTLWATGVHDLLRISQAFERPVGNGVKGQAALFDFDKAGCAQIFADSLHFVPHKDGSLAVGSTSERDYIDPVATDDVLLSVINRAIAVFPELAYAKILKTWAGVRPRAKSRAPVLGRHPLDDSAYIANGGFKIGFGIAPAVATIMADFMLEGKETIPDDFSVDSCLL